MAQYAQYLPNSYETAVAVLSDTLVTLLSIYSETYFSGHLY